MTEPTSIEDRRFTTTADDVAENLRETAQELAGVVTTVLRTAAPRTGDEDAAELLEAMQLLASRAQGLVDDAQVLTELRERAELYATWDQQEQGAG